MADLNLGTLIVSTIKQKTTIDQFATFDANDGLGGLYSTTSIAGRDGIPNVRRREGMLCYVSGSGSYQLVGGLSNSNWQPFSSGTGSNSLTASYALTASYYLPSSHSYITQIGDGVNTNYIISHNLGTKNLIYSMFDVSSSNAVIPDVFFVNDNQVRLEFFNTVSLNQYELTLTPGNNLVNYFISGSNISGDYVVTSSGSNTNETASYSLKSNEAFSSSYSLHSLTATMASSSIISETASFAIFADSSSYALTASYALNSNTGSFSDFVITASGANNNSTASYALTSSISDISISASYSLTSSYSLTASYVLNSTINIETGGFVITSSGALTNETASCALTASYYSPSSHSYVTKIGNNIDSVYAINHNLGTKNLVYSMFDVSSSNAIIPDIFFVNNNQVRLEFNEIIEVDRYELTLTPGNNLVNYNIGAGTSVETSSYMNGFSGSGSLSNTAGAIDLFLNININGINYKIPLHSI